MSDLVMLLREVGHMAIDILRRRLLRVRVEAG